MQAASSTNVTIILASIPKETRPPGERLLAIHMLMRPLYSEDPKQGPLVVLARYHNNFCYMFFFLFCSWHSYNKW